MTWHRLVILLISLFLVLLLFYKGRPVGEKPDKTAFVVSKTPVLWVELSGDLQKPGVFAVDDKLMAIDVIKMAKPFCSEPDYKILISASGRDIAGRRIKVRCISGFAGVCELDEMSVDTLLVLGLPLDISRISQVDLERVPGIGVIMAQRIIEYRQLNGGKMTVSDLKNINGIGDVKFLQLKKMFK